MLDDLRRLVALDREAEERRTENWVLARVQRDALARRIGPACARLVLRFHEGLVRGWLDTPEDRAGVAVALESEDPAAPDLAFSVVWSRGTGHRLALAYEPGPDPPFSVVCLDCDPRWLVRLPVDPLIDAVVVARAAHDLHVAQQG